MTLRATTTPPTNTMAAIAIHLTIPIPHSFTILYHSVLFTPAAYPLHKALIHYSHKIAGERNGGDRPVSRLHPLKKNVYTIVYTCTYHEPLTCTVTHTHIECTTITAVDLVYTIDPSCVHAFEH
jgi:hypothetical protein